MIIENIRHTGIITDCIEESLKIYKNILGFEPYSDQFESGEFIDHILGLKDVKVRTVKMRLPGTDFSIELLDYQTNQEERKERKVNSIGIGHIAMTTSDIEFLYQRLLSEKVESLSSPKLNEGRTHKVCFMKTPEGTFLEIVQEMS